MDELLRLFDEQVRRHVPAAGFERADRVIRAVGAWRGVVWSDLDAASADAIIAREIERFAGLGEWEWKHYSYDQPPDLPDRLRAAGFVPEEDEALLFARIADLPLDSPPPDGVTLRPVRGADEIEAFLQVGETVFGRRYDGLGEDLLRDIEAGRAAAVLAMAGDRPICSGRIDFYEEAEFAGLFGGATVPEWRHRGVFRSVVAHRAALAAQRGYRYLQVDASSDSRPILERLGFVRLATTTPYVHP
jgi:GNAT superfamily N-acetyltransferase